MLSCSTKNTSASTPNNPESGLAFLESAEYHVCMDEKVTIRTEYSQKEDGTFHEKRYVGNTLIYESDC
jgi:hypothetical protein